MKRTMMTKTMMTKTMMTTQQSLEVLWTKGGRLSRVRQFLMKSEVRHSETRYIHSRAQQTTHCGREQWRTLESMERQLFCARINLCNSLGLNGFRIRVQRRADSSPEAFCLYARSRPRIPIFQYSNGGKSSPDRLYQPSTANQQLRIAICATTV